MSVILNFIETVYKYMEKYDFAEVSNLAKYKFENNFVNKVIT